MREEARGPAPMEAAGQPREASWHSRDKPGLWEQADGGDEMVLGKRWTGRVLVQCPVPGWPAEIQLLSQRS